MKFERKLETPAHGKQWHRCSVGCLSQGHFAGVVLHTCSELWVWTPLAHHPQHPKRKLAVKNSAVLNYNFKCPDELQPILVFSFALSRTFKFCWLGGQWSLSYPFYQNMLTVLCRQSGICKTKINFWILQEKYTIHTQFLLILIFRSFCVVYIKKSMSKVNCASLLTLSSTFIIIEYPLLYAVLRNSFWVVIVDHLNYLPTRQYGITFQLRALQI